MRTPLEFDAPALSGWDVHRAALDVNLDDYQGYALHALRFPPAGWQSGWLAHPGTLKCSIPWGTSGSPWTPPGIGVVSDLPVWTAEAVRTGVLVPIYTRRVIQEGARG